MLDDVIAYKREIYEQLEETFRGLGQKKAPVCIYLDENGVYVKESLWDKDSIVCVNPIPDDYQISHEALEILLAEIAQPEEIEKLLSLETLSLSEIKLSNPGLYAKVLDEIIQMSCDEALKNFDEILSVYTARQRSEISESPKRTAD